MLKYLISKISFQQFVKFMTIILDKRDKIKERRILYLQFFKESLKKILMIFIDRYKCINMRYKYI